MFDIGIGEIIVIAVVGLLVFGPEKLPRAAADAGRMLRQARELAARSRKELADTAGVDLNDTLDTVRSLGDLHPKRIASSLLSDDAPTSSTKPTPASAPAFDPDAT